MYTLQCVEIDRIQYYLTNEYTQGIESIDQITYKVSKLIK